MSKNTVLGYKKGSKPVNIFSDFENMYFQLSNALSIVFIRCLDTTTFSEIAELQKKKALYKQKSLLFA